ncbi:hypothetical protein Agub_g3547, partial [Astrephomene gubernaculifera]
MALRMSGHRRRAADGIPDALDLTPLGVTLSGSGTVSSGSSSNTSGSSASPSCSPSSSSLTSAYSALSRTALNRASCLVGAFCAEAATAAASPTAAAATAAAASAAMANGHGHAHACTVGSSGLTHGSRGGVLWGSKEFMFERYPLLLHAARRFGYPLQALRLYDYADGLQDFLATAPGHELASLGPEGLARVLTALASISCWCCRDPHWAAAFERACLCLIAVQFDLGYTHPDRWLGLLRATVQALPYPLPGLAAAMRSLMVRLCDVRRYGSYVWELLPLVDVLERRAASAAGKGTASGGVVGSSMLPAGRQQQQMRAQVCGQGSSAGRTYNRNHSIRSKHTSVRSFGSTAAGGGVAAAAVAAGGSPYRWQRTAGYPAAGSGQSSSGSGSGGVPASARKGTGSQVPCRCLSPPPDLSSHLVSDEEYGRWLEEAGRVIAGSMVGWSEGR